MVQDADQESGRRWLIVGVVCLGQLMVVLDATVVNIALPTAQHDLAFSNADRQWVVTSYSLAFGGLLLLGVLTEYLSWRWCLYVNVVFSLVAVTAAVRLLHNQPRDPSVRLDPPGIVLVVVGLIGVVSGLSEAETKGWAAPLTIALLVGGVVLLVAFVLVERRVAHPLLPLRIVLDRFRGGAYLAIGLSATGMFGIFLTHQAAAVTEAAAPVPA
jgi:MFS family permease